MELCICLGLEEMVAGLMVRKNEEKDSLLLYHFAFFYNAFEDDTKSRISFSQ